MSNTNPASPVAAAPVVGKDSPSGPVVSEKIFAQRMVGRLLTSFSVRRFADGSAGVVVRTESGRSAAWEAACSLSPAERDALAASLK